MAIGTTNVPQWYITFWATTKIGAVLVTVNTAYKIHEAEYLLRQSDTHTLVMVDGYKDSDYIAIMKELCPELETLKKDILFTAKDCHFYGILLPANPAKRVAGLGKKLWQFRKKSRGRSISPGRCY